MNNKENIDDWKPYFLKFGKDAYSKKFPFARNVGFYDRNWYCQENHTIHTNEKQVLNCPSCSKKYYK